MNFNKPNFPKCPKCDANILMFDEMHECGETLLPNLAIRRTVGIKKPLFIPLVGEHYDRFERGEKSFEFRRYKSPWTEKNCIVGRAVVLSRGYGKANRLHGVINSFEIKSGDQMTPEQSWIFDRIYNGWTIHGGRVAVIGIKVLRPA